MTSDRRSGFFLNPVAEKLNGTASRSTSSRNASIPSSPNSMNPSNGKNRIMRDVAGSRFHAGAHRRRGEARGNRSPGGPKASGFQARGRTDARRIPEASTSSRKNAIDLARRPLRALRAAEAANPPQGLSASSRPPPPNIRTLSSRNTGHRATARDTRQARSEYTDIIATTGKTGARTKGIRSSPRREKKSPKPRLPRTEIRIQFSGPDRQSHDETRRIPSARKEPRGRKRNARSPGRFPVRRTFRYPLHRALEPPPRERRRKRALRLHDRGVDDTGTRRNLAREGEKTEVRKTEEEKIQKEEVKPNRGVRGEESFGRKHRERNGRKKRQGP